MNNFEHYAVTPYKRLKDHRYWLCMSGNNLVCSIVKWHKMFCDICGTTVDKVFPWDKWICHGGEASGEKWCTKDIPHTIEICPSCGRNKYGLKMFDNFYYNYNYNYGY